MNREIKLIVGLGNPGKRYQDTWHNLGATTIIALSNRLKVGFHPGKGDFLSAEYRLRNRKVGLMIPTSYMNRSGGPVLDWMNYYKIEPTEVLIVYDDHDMELGRIRIRESGSPGGHRGMEDIVRHLGTFDVPRLKIGIRTEREKSELSDQVLSMIPTLFKARVEEVIENVCDAVEMIIKEDITSAMTRFNGFEII